MKKKIVVVGGLITVATLVGLAFLMYSSSTGMKPESLPPVKRGGSVRPR
jgi:hypothetical protein